LKAKEKETDEGFTVYYLNIEGIIGNNGQMIDIPIIVANPFQAISSYDKQVPSLYFTMDIEDDPGRVPAVNTKYYLEEFDSNGELAAIEYKRQGDPVNYNFSLTAELRSEREAIYIMNYLRTVLPVPSGRFFWKNDFDGKKYSYTYINSVCTRSRELFNIVTENSIVTMSFTVIGFWDFKPEVRIEREIVKDLIITNSKK